VQAAALDRYDDLLNSSADGRFDDAEEEEEA